MARTEISRRQFLAGAGGAAATALAGCGGTGGGMGSGPSGSVGQGIPTNSTISPDDADIVVESADALVQALQQNSGVIIWIPGGTVIDLSGRDIVIDSGNTVASDRGIDGSAGALITTTDRGAGTPVRAAGQAEALIGIHGEGRLSGVGVRGPLYNYTDSQYIPGFVPWAPGETYAQRSNWRSERYCRGISLQSDDAIVDNCEIWGWESAIMVGARGTAVDPYILQCYIHDCMMMSLGYCVDVKRGNPTIYQCLFNAYRHALNGFGYADAGYTAIQCTFGDLCCGHVLDMHGVHNNISGSTDSSALDYRWRAGGRMEVRGCNIMATSAVDDRYHNGTDAGTWAPDPYLKRVPDGPVEHVHLRAVPADGYYFRNNNCALEDPMEALNQTSIIGSTNQYNFRRLFFEGNEWGVDF